MELMMAFVKKHVLRGIDMGTRKYNPNSFNYIGDLHQQRLALAQGDVALSLLLPRLELLGSFSSFSSLLMGCLSCLGTLHEL